MKKVNSFLINLANLIFLFHVFWVIYVIVGVFYIYPGFFWTLHLWASILIVIGVVLNECPLTTFERWVRRKAGQKNIPNRGSRLLEVFYKYTKIKLPNSLMRILGMVYFIVGTFVHLVR